MRTIQRHLTNESKVISNGKIYHANTSDRRDGVGVGERVMMLSISVEEEIR